MQFVGKVITSVSEFYKDINPSTLSGAIDVLVVEDIKTGQLSCSPFHVRFGKLLLLRPQEKVVEIRVNGKPVDIWMKVGEAGETFFVLPSQGKVDDEYLTSPLVKPLPPVAGIDALSLSPRKERVQSDGEDVSVLKKRDQLGALSDSELDTQKQTQKEFNHPNVFVGSPPKYSWMWGALPQKDDKSKNDDIDSLEVSEVSSTKSTPADIAITMSDPLTTEPNTATTPDITTTINTDTDTDTNINTDTTATTTSANANAVAVAVKQELMEGGGESLSNERVDVFEYVNRPIFFKLNYDIFCKADSLESIAIFRPRSETSNFLLDIKDITEQSEALVKKLEEYLIRLEWNAVSDDPTIILNDLTNLGKKSLLLINQKIMFSGPVGYSLIIGKMMFNQIMKLESIFKKFPFLDPNWKEPEKKSSWRWWSRSHTVTTPPASTSSGPESPKPTAIDSTGAKHVARFSFTGPEESSDASPKVYYTKSLRLPHEALLQLDLNDGVNTVSYTVGNATCTARIFRWKSDSRIVISDIDGTITKSDALGHLFTFVGKDWTHSDIANLYTNIFKNGYKFVYLTSRSLGQANITRGYLKGVEQNKFQLPDGPVIMSPDRLLAALRREVVLGNPQEFKIACLQDLQKLFFDCQPEGSSLVNPFFSGFGNRSNDAHAYEAIGIPTQRIFIINPSGNVSIEPLADQYSSSYGQLIELVDSIFPPVISDRRNALPLEEPFNEFWFWRRPISLAPMLMTEPVQKKESIMPLQDLAFPDDEGLEEAEEEGLVPAYYV